MSDPIERLERIGASGEIASMIDSREIAALIRFVRDVEAKAEKIERSGNSPEWKEVAPLQAKQARNLSRRLRAALAQLREDLR